jgi:hypothetical protein
MFYFQMYAGCIDIMKRASKTGMCMTIDALLTRMFPEGKDC